MTKKLTHRQQQFLSQFLDLYREMKHSIHYITVAERLGVGKVTAYEMLRLLEDHGLVRAEYQANPEQHGPGRSVVLFYPTQEADRLIKNLAGNSAYSEDWQIEKEQILQKLRTGEVGGYEELLTNLLSRISEKRSPLIFATEMITSVILTLVEIQDSPEIRLTLERLRKIGLPKELSLSVMSGISVLLSALDRSNRRSTEILMTQINRYEDSLSQLSEDSRVQLSEFTREIVQILAR